MKYTTTKEATIARIADKSGRIEVSPDFNQLPVYCQSFIIRQLKEYRRLVAAGETMTDRMSDADLNTLTKMRKVYSSKKIVAIVVCMAELLRTKSPTNGNADRVGEMFKYLFINNIPFVL